MERAFKFTNFRNFGLEKPERLVINHTLEKGKLGELIILIGPNNSGKSNVLDALFGFNNKRLTERDVTTLEYDDEFQHPEISFTIKDDDGNVFGKSLSLEKSKSFIEEKKPIKLNIGYKIEDGKNLINLINDCLIKYGSSMRNYGVSNYFNELSTIVDSIKIKDEASCELLANKIFDSDFMQKYRNNYLNNTNYYSHINSILKDIGLRISNSSLYSKRMTKGGKIPVEDLFKSKFDLNLVPNIIRYQEKNIEEKDLACLPNGIKQNCFFSTLFSEKEITKINNVYANLNKHHSISLLKELTREFDDKIQKINNMFNKMYFAENDKYNFSLVFESQKIYFGIERDEKSVILNYQSTGFKWFFNFYFNFLSQNRFLPGDIIIMDEPATNLHPQGQVELRKFIKELARRTDITFVIATHSPFLIDVDNYDELRIIFTKKNKAHIENLFSAINIDDPDTLLPIKESLTIRQHILYDYNTTVIFVEGITDYNYLTLFKKIYSKENIAFVPIQGIGNTNELQEKIINKLIKINRHPILLVDSDKAGKSAVNKGRNKNIEIHTLDEFIPNVKEIEDLFSKQDQTKHRINEKNAYISSLIKNTTCKDDFTEETLINFKTVLEKLEN